MKISIINFSGVTQALISPLGRGLPAGLLGALLAVSAVPCRAASPAASAVVAATVDFRIARQAIAGGPKIVKARQGDAVVLRFTSDQADEIHVHGYQRTVRLVPGVAAEITLSLTRSGRFAIEGHTSHLELGALEVYPR